jgi:hypothetical protein
MATKPVAHQTVQAGEAAVGADDATLYNEKKTNAADQMDMLANLRRDDNRA